jgi:NTE family protein
MKQVLPQHRFARRRVIGAVAALIATLLSGCAAFNYVDADAPIAKSKLEPLNPRPKIAVVLGSGGPRGYAHVGIIKVLAEAGIVPDLIVGSSVGALIGAYWASGMSADEIDVIANSGGPLTLFDLNPFADRGWIRGQKLQDYVNRGLDGKTFEQLRTPLVIVATRRDDKAPTFFTQGNLGVAVRASSAVPQVISPVGIRGVEYEDGDESLPVAVRAARDAGAQFIIAVDVSAHPASTPPEAAPHWIARDNRRRSRIDPEVAQADFLLHPDMGYWASPRKSYFEMAQRIGEADARTRLPELKARLAQAGIK